MTKVLVTGVGAIIGYGVIRALRMASCPVDLVGMDIYPDAVGQQWCDEFDVALPAADAEYPAFLADLVGRRNVDLVLPAIEQDVLRMNQEREVLSQAGVAIALNASDLIELSHDKWSTHRLLIDAGFPTIPTEIEGSFQSLAAAFGTPFLLKPRRSYASKGIVEVRDEAEFSHFAPRMGDDFMAQMIVGRPSGREYTVGAFGLGDGTTAGCVVMERTLSREGATARARIRRLPDLEAIVAALASLFRPVGPTNFQFREHEGQYLLLEINPRLSSSVSLRAAFGYNEPEMCLEHYLGGRNPKAPVIRDGSAVRYIEDAISLAGDLR